MSNWKRLDEPVTLPLFWSLPADAITSAGIGVKGAKARTFHQEEPVRFIQRQYTTISAQMQKYFATAS